MYAIIDVGNWQDIVELKSGRSIDLPPGSFKALRALAAQSLYPGDKTDESVFWVRRCAQKLHDMHAPQWMLLSYTQPLFNEMYNPRNKEAAAARQALILTEIEQFAAQNGYMPIIVMTGGYVPLKEEIFQPPSKGVLESWAWGINLAAVSGAGAGDAEILRAQPHIRQVVSKEEILAAHGGLHENFRYYLPDYIVEAEDGYGFRGYNSHQPRLYMADIREERLPVQYAGAAKLEHTRDIYAAQLHELQNGKKVLLCIIEGYDTELIPPHFQFVDNCEEWYAYRGLDLYLALLTGRAFYETPYAPVYDRTRPKKEEVNYPFGGFFEDFPPHTVAEAAHGSAAVSSRSMIAHMAANADIALECYNRDRSQMGVLLAFKPEKFSDGGNQR